MKIDFNNLRLNTLKCYSKIVKKLNENITTIGCSTKVVTVDAEKIKSDLDNLRCQLLNIACTQQDECKNFDDLGSEIKEIPIFNPTERD